MIGYLKHVWDKYILEPDLHDDEYYRDLGRISKWNIPTSLDTDVNPELYNEEFNETPKI